jgi:Trk-type K+ transport system membrane component
MYSLFVNVYCTIANVCLHNCSYIYIYIYIYISYIILGTIKYRDFLRVRRNIGNKDLCDKSYAEKNGCLKIAVILLFLLIIIYVIWALTTVVQNGALQLLKNTTIYKLGLASFLRTDVQIVNNFGRKLLPCPWEC